MSYQIAIVVKDGKATVDEGATSLPPEGRFTINGHVPSEGTWQAETIQVMRVSPENSIVIQASGTHYL